MTPKLAEIEKLFAKDDFPGAMQKCDEMLLQSPDDLDVLIFKAKLLAIPSPDVNNPDLAIRLLHQVLVREPDSAEVYEALGYVYQYGASEYSLAFLMYKKALELGLVESRIYLSLAELYRHPGVDMTLDESLGYLQIAISKSPNNWEIRRALATRLWEKGHFGEAEKELQKALSNEPAPDALSKQQIEKWIENTRTHIPFEKGYWGRVDQPA